MAGEESRLAAQYEALVREAAEKTGAEQVAAAAEEAAHDALRQASDAAARAAAEAVEAARTVAETEERHRAAVGERRALEAEARSPARHLARPGGGRGAGLESPATTRVGRARRVVSCDAGYERALAAALAQVSGALVVPTGTDHWSLLGALKEAGIGLVRLVAPPARQRAALAFPGAAPRWTR